MPINTAAFLYCWTNLENNKMYIGSHVGNVNDGYICSSKPMRKEYKENPKVFIRHIIAEGNERDIRNLETNILKNLDAANSDEFYNLNNHSYPQKSGWRHSAESLKKISEAGTRRHSEETKKYLSELFKNSPPNPGKRSKETKKKMSKAKIGNLSNTGRVWINNSIKSVMIGKEEVIPEGFIRGRGGFYGVHN